MKIIKETNRRVVEMQNYRGVCDGCQTPLEYPEPLIIIVIYESEKLDVVVPADRLVCPNCFKELITINVYRNLDVTEEIKGLKR